MMAVVRQPPLYNKITPTRVVSRQRQGGSTRDVQPTSQNKIPATIIKNKKICWKQQQPTDSQIQPTI